jgi:hypothetical protein
MDISGSNYRILNSARSAIYSSTSSSAAFNWLLGWGGHASSGNTVYVQAGAYSVDSTWVIAISGVTVVFQSPMPSSPNIMGNYVGSGTTSSANGAILTAVANLNTWIMAVYGNNVVISGLTEDGNAVNQYGGTWTYPSTNPYNSIGGVYVEANNVLIKYSTIHDMRSWGVSINGDYNGVTNSLIYRIGANGYTTSSWTVVHTGNFVVNSEVYACSDVGLCSQSENTVFTGNYVHDIYGAYSSQYPQGQTHGQRDSYWAIAWEAGYGGSGTYALCAGNVVSNVQHMGIGVAAQGTMSNVLISGNTVSNCQGGYYGAISVHGSYNIVEYNTVSSSVIGVHVGGDGAAANINVYGNTLSGNTHNYVDAGSGTTITQPSVVAVTVTSSPTGAGFVSANGNYGYAGPYSTSPYTFYATVGSSVSLVANTVSGYVFNGWNDNGAQSHSISVPSTDTSYKATYRTNP